MKKSCLIIGTLLWGMSAFAQTTIWKRSGWECRISDKGTLEQIIFKGSQRNDTIPFFREKGNAGPSFYANLGKEDINAEWIPDGYRSYRATIEDVECRLTYKEWKGQPAMEITLENKGHVPFQPIKAGLKLGIDTYMDKYPDWFGKYFPTLMLNEKTHFYGYLQTPSGHTLGIVSPQPVASWSVDYNLGYQDPAPHWFMGHRIESLNLDLMNTLPLPAHCPQDLWRLKQGESKTWTIAFIDIKTPGEFEETIHKVANVPMIRMNQTAFQPKETAVFEVLAASPVIEVINDKGEKQPVTIKGKSGNMKGVSCLLPATGLYTVKVTDGGKQSEGVLFARASWEWTMEQARTGALKYHQKATSHIESWYGFHSSFIAAKYFPEKKQDEALRNRFDSLFGLLHEQAKMIPLYHASRIQNTSGTIGLLVDKYEAYHDIEDLKKASRLADWLMNTWQRKDGAYVNHNTVYTSVIYVAKSMLELTLAERELGKQDAAWKEAADRHYASAKRAIDQLVASQGDFETEGELTFEDGMIPCSALQIGMLALMQPDEKERKHYTDAMLQILNSHDCLTQLRVPDARRRGGTMRYWEAQYDVQMLPNMFNSPHGWSGWRAYATYYAYLLTGEERWLKETYNAMGAFSNLIDYRTGDLRWAFVVDPYLKVKQACSADTHVTADSLSFGNPHPELYDTREFVIGEQYVNMISDWQTVNTQDNDVHELFKCIGEAMLTNAFIVERANGEIIGYNCHVTRQGNKLTVKADEKQITHLHCNLKKPYTVSFNGKTHELAPNYLGWAFGKDIYAH
ncbi:MAG: hypothetical protein LUI85_15950 [Bacteroides sp.]|nr:hypothetical protein [Bacteroides sp.]